MSITITTEMSRFHCHGCGLPYQVSTLETERRTNSGVGWNCPYCRVGTILTRETETQKYRRLAEQAQRERDMARTARDRARDERDTAERQRNAQKAAKTRVMNRIKRGECPCCGKTFADLHKHMETQHPTYAE